MRPTDGQKLIATNRKARHDYHVEESVEAGLVLTGTEVKSLRSGRASIQDAFARVEGDEVWLYHMHIPPYDSGGYANHDPLRRRKLLLHGGEIRRLFGKAQQKGYTLVPLRLYFKRGVAKLELALARGKREYDRREEIARREADRQIQRAMRARTPRSPR